MSQLLDSILIALRAIWSNKLRSFMTVLGNIVAVTSIVTVVSLIQGLNAIVSRADRQRHRCRFVHDRQARNRPFRGRRGAHAQ